MIIFIVAVGLGVAVITPLIMAKMPPINKRNEVNFMTVKDSVYSVISDFLFARKYGTYEECEKAVYLYPSDVIDFLAFLDSQGERNACDIAAAYEEVLWITTNLYTFLVA